MVLIAPGDVCLDIGANIGYYSVLFSNLVGPKGKVIAIEPDPDNFQLLIKNCTSYQESHSVSLHQLALGAQEGIARLFKRKDNHGMHRLYSSVCCSEDSSEVSVIRGDELQTGPVDFLKIDIEGYELPALTGLKDTICASGNIKVLTEFSPLSISEAGFSSRGMIELMLKYGLAPLENVDSLWRPVDSNELLTAADIADKVDIKALSLAMKSHTNKQVSEAAVAALLEVGYPRPMLENLAWIHPHHVTAIVEKLTQFSMES